MRRSIAKTMQSTVMLNDGVKMPVMGLGMAKMSSGEGKEAERAVEHALKRGYRMIDTAELYGNEADVGRAVQKSGLNRDQIFIVTKLWENGAERCRKIFGQSMKMLDLDYVDLYLIHSPKDGKNIETYTTMLEFKAQGLVRSVGVSNFGVHHLEGLKAAHLPKPSVNQIELHPWQQKREIVKYCRENDIAVMAFSPLTKGRRLDDPVLQNLSQKYNKTPAQILIRWNIEHSFIPIPKSSSLKNIEDNTDVFDWSIADDDMKILDELPDWSCSWDACESPWIG